MGNNQDTKSAYAFRGCLISIVLMFAAACPEQAKAEPRSCGINLTDPLKAELQAAYRSGSDFSNFAEIKADQKFDELFDDPEALFAAIQTGRCQAVVVDGATAALLKAAMDRDTIGNDVFEVLARDAVLNSLWQRKGYPSEASFLFSRSVSPPLDTDEVKEMARLGVFDQATYQAAMGRMTSSGYSSKRTSSQLNVFLEDEKAGASSGKSAVVVQQERRERERQEELAARRAHLAEFPYNAIITCGINGSHIATQACFTDTDLELRNGSAYALLRIGSIDQAGIETAVGLVVSLRRNFSIRAQNSDDTLVLGIEIQDAATRQVLFQQQASRFRTITVSR